MGILFNYLNPDYYTKNSAIIEHSPPFTIAGMISINNQISLSTLLSIGDIGDTSKFSLLYAAGSSSRASWGIFGDTGFEAANAGPEPDINTWFHVCGVESAFDNHSSFYNGGNKDINTDSVESVGWNNTRIGATADSTPTWYMAGVISHLVIYNTNLIDDAVASLGIGGWPPYINQYDLISFIQLDNRGCIDIVAGGDWTPTGSPSTIGHKSMAPWPGQQQ